MSTGLWVVLGIIAAAVMLFVVIYNRLVSLRTTVTQSWSDIDVMLKQRLDLVPNLVESVKGAAGHERGTLEAVIAARNAAASAHGPAEAGVAQGALSSALRQVFALSEAYPTLRANENFLGLQRELSDLENKIAASRRFFNNSVAEFNAAIGQIPAVLFAGAMGFRAQESFSMPEDERKVAYTPPAVKF
ncbi:LemA protein [Humitalea rosea]|uniref:LemA protein n=1 Tax=Humitalea rosea TaxID=990373 RepID=A0A2W7IS62_9PROT|nr:LemA family protein [Humitalea rosea]PZW50456.1 LemA protein [Humitalea rosea]